MTILLMTTTGPMTMNNFAFNFRGTFGSGKSVVPLNLYRRTPENERETCFRPPSLKKVLFVVLHPYKIVIVGGYDKACGGIDSFIPFATAVEAIEAAATRAKELGYDLIMEGVILSSTLSGSLNIYKSMQENYDLTPVPIFMNTPPERCVENVNFRNGGKGLKDGGESIRSKHHGVWDNQRPQIAKHYPVKIFKTEGINTDQMVERFLALQKKLHKEAIA